MLWQSLNFGYAAAGCRRLQKWTLNPKPQTAGDPQDISGLPGITGSPQEGLVSRRPASVGCRPGIFGDAVPGTFQGKHFGTLLGCC